jgi:hypothetical protein
MPQRAVELQPVLLKQLLKTSGELAAKDAAQCCDVYFAGSSSPGSSRLFSEDSCTFPVIWLHSLNPRSSPPGSGHCFGNIGSSIPNHRLVERLNLTQHVGVLVVHVESASPADKAGLLPGDILLDVDEQNFGHKGPTSLVFRLEPNRDAKIAGIRGGQQFSTMIHVGERPRRQA